MITNVIIIEHLLMILNYKAYIEIMNK